MSRLLLAWILLCALLSAQDRPAAPAPDPLAAPQPDFSALTFTRYQLQIDLDPEQHFLRARGTVTLRNDSARAQPIAMLQISSSLTWRSVSLGEHALGFHPALISSDLDHTGKISQIAVTLPSALAPQQEVILQIGYEGAIPRDLTRLTRIDTPLEIAGRSDWDQIAGGFTALRGAGNVLWYPICIPPALLTDGNRVFTALGEWQAAQAATIFNYRVCSSGPKLPRFLLSDIPLSLNETAECTSASLSPLAGRTPIIVIAAYSLLNSRAGTFHYFAPEVTLNKDEGAASAAVANDFSNTATRLLPLVNMWLGPVRHMDVMQLPIPGGFPYEDGHLLLVPFAPADLKQVQLRLIHTMTHGGFDSPRIWLREGVAHFMQAMVREQQNGRAAALAYMDQNRGALALIEPEPVPAPPTLSAPDPAPPAASKDPASRSLINAHDPVFFRTKAMYVLWMLRDMVGDEALKRTLHAYSASDDRSPAYFQQLLATQSHRPADSLEWFFDEWVYRDKGLPQFRVLTAAARVTLGKSYQVVATIEDSGDASAEVPITVTTEGGEISKRFLIKARDKTVVRIQVPALPLRITVNDGSVPVTDPTSNSSPIEIVGGARTQ